MNSLRLINLIHSDPLDYIATEKFEVSRSDTRSNLRDLLDGKVDYAMISLVDYFKNRESIVLIDGPTISGKGKSDSNLLVSNGIDPFPGMRIAVTSETETTAFFLKIILQRLYPESELIRSRNNSVVDLLKEEDFALVIGNRALDIYRTDTKIIFDITHMISKLFNMHSIYAVTASLNGREYDENLVQLKNIPRWTITRDLERISKEHNLEKSILAEYYNSLTYDLNNLMKKEIITFMKYYDEIREDIFLENIDENSIRK